MTIMIIIACYAFKAILYCTTNICVPIINYSPCIQSYYYIGRTTSKDKYIILYIRDVVT